MILKEDVNDLVLFFSREVILQVPCDFYDVLLVINGGFVLYEEEGGKFIGFLVDSIGV